MKKECLFYIVCRPEVLVRPAATTGTGPHYNKEENSEQQPERFVRVREAYYARQAITTTTGHISGTKFSKVTFHAYPGASPKRL